MLKKFAVKNYRGFTKRIELDLSKPSNYAFNQYAISKGIIKNGIIYGPNGIGKSNLGLAIFDIEYHLAQLKSKKNDYYSNFVYAGNANLFVEFEYLFDFDGQEVSYNYSKASGGKLKKEELKLNNDTVFTRDNDAVRINEKYFPNTSSIEEQFQENANNVSVISYLLAVYPLGKEHFLIKLHNFVDGMLWFASLETREFIGVETKANGSIEEYIINNGLVDDFAMFLKRVSGQEFEFIQPQEGETMLWYKVGDSRLPFCFTVSTGTRSLELFYFWLRHMKDTTFVFIDEFDAFYHFRLAYNICKELFSLPCQVFLSSHNTYLMTNDLLRPDCNFILNDGEIKSLNECTDKELRFGHNIEKLFRGKAFGV
ncbi:MAG: ATP-binding protein [Muribaculaceae bacterium]|nr:ATP-binding protein [Muribaculaceae bacterium]